ncbi:HIT/MYND zinc finger-like protein [Glarea lozoyensis ATCC 20868]|uniref:HIT/MYND zinc finger-like protein n=1 Tax=Glarea lozoyensis (strain ATCC 20868 / MF5171) TaxID=1116229 RepID=S3CP55_GLAL2|nr:HIT/MYND zinc finger-like protein [Glarea lozoyensis ATCC 20868]EPE28252.1 HIT/MYND zinc finger-like protein [Glarea lozoyensis ATCC 20868]
MDDPDVAQFPQRTLNEGCGLCGKETAPLSRCSSCKVIYYCCHDHQDAHSESHEGTCNKIKNAYNTIQEEELKLRAIMQAAVFANVVGSSYPRDLNRLYVITQRNLFHALDDIQTRSAVQAKINSMREVLRLDPGDNFRVRYVGSFLMLRIGQLQEAYDFIKYYAIAESKPNYDLKEVREGFRKDQDVFEDVRHFCVPSTELYNLVALAILKFKLLQDLRAIAFASEVTCQALPIELRLQIQEMVPFSPFIANNSKFTANPRYALELSNRMAEQLLKLVRAIHYHNAYFFSALQTPYHDLLYYSENDCEGSSEVWYALQVFYNTWCETPGAVSYILKMWMTFGPAETELLAPVIPYVPVEKMSWIRSLFRKLDSKRKSRRAKTYLKGPTGGPCYR